MLRKFNAGQNLELNSIAVLADPVFDKDDARFSAGIQAANLQTVAAGQTERGFDLSNENLNLPRLKATGDEAKEIRLANGSGKFLLKKGFEVNRALLEGRELDAYNIVHIATHGIWDSNHPELSMIALSRFDQQGNGLNGFMHLNDIYNLKMKKQLVVLSACQSALGQDIKGEGMVALTRGFMYAGAARVIASLWKVEEDATVDLMKDFYQNLLHDKQTVAASLQQAQIAAWRKHPDKAPYSWAAFVLQGEYR